MVFFSFTARMIKPSLIPRDYKTPMNNASTKGKKTRVPAMLIGIFVLLIAVFYFKDTTSSVQTTPAGNDDRRPHLITIPLPDASGEESNTSTPNVNIQKSVTTSVRAAFISKDTQRKYTVKSGDSLAKIFSKLKYSPTALHNIMQAGAEAEQLKNIKPGQALRFMQNNNGNCTSIAYDIDRVKTLNITSTEFGFVSSISEKPVEITHSTASAKINDSLFYDAKQVGLPDKTIMELANIFAWDIDFSQGLRQGDSFTILYETRHIDGKQIENGNILTAEFINRNNKYQAVRFVSEDGHAEYFSPDGKSTRKAFLRNPIDFVRISSRFSLRRKHPVLSRIRAHEGVDYAAATGTPIKSTGDGKVIFRGLKGGYGRTIIIQHGQKYSTLYAHMSKYGRYKKGKRIKQGQVIGYVGRSGLATGPHLHYELRINGVHKNPLTAKFPAAKPVTKNLLAQFKQQALPLLAQLELAKEPTSSQ